MTAGEEEEAQNSVILEGRAAGIALAGGGGRVACLATRQQ